MVKQALLVFIVIQLLLSSIIVDCTGESTEIRSIASIWPTLSKLLQTDTRAAACLFMRSPPAECFQGRNMLSQKRNSDLIPEVADEEDMTSSCEGRNCGGRLRTLEDSRRDDPLTGPKRFYNNW